MLDIGSARSATAGALDVRLLRHLKEKLGSPPGVDLDFDFVVGPFCDAPAVARSENAASGTGAPLCHIGYDAARIVIGPVVRPGGSPCMRCVQLWAPALGMNRRDLALPDPLVDMLAAQVLAYVDRWRNGPASSLMPIWWIDADTFSRSEHRLSPHPECELCGAARHPPAPFMAGELCVDAATWRAQDRPRSTFLTGTLVDARFGLVRQFECETEAVAHPMTFAAFVGRGDPRRLEIGVGRSGCQAVDQDVAILEALERFSGFRPRERIETVTARHADVALIASDPRSFILPDAAQHVEPGFELAAFAPDMAYEWTWAHSLRRGTRVLVPLQLAYYDLPTERLPGNQRFVSETSNGCALGGSVEEAALFGLFEVLERDAYLTTWYGRLVPRRLDAGRIDDRHIAGMIVRIEAAGFTVFILDIGVGFPIATYAVLAVDRRADASAASHVSTGAHFNPVEALRGALVEVCTRIQLRPAAIVAASHTRAAAMLLDDTLVRDMDDHASLYAFPASLSRLDFLTAGRGQAAVPGSLAYEACAKADLNGALRTLADAVLAVADDVLVVDLSNALTRSVGLHCVKVLAPGLLPITFGHQYRRVSADRIAAAAMATGRAWERNGAYRPHNFQ